MTADGVNRGDRDSRDSRKRPGKTATGANLFRYNYKLVELMSTHSSAVLEMTAKKDMQRVCGSLLIVATILLSGRFACAVPFAALAALAAVANDRKNGIILMGLIWLGNQALGFGFLNYPLEFSCVGWGLMLGISVLLGLFAARLAVVAFRRVNAFIQACAALLFAFCAYEGSLYAASVATASSEAAFSWPTIEEVAAINAGSFAVLFCLYRAFLAAGLLRKSMLQVEGGDFPSLNPQSA